MSFLLDTDICSAFHKGNHLVGHKVFRHGGRLFVSAISAGELFAWGLRARSSPQGLADLLAFLGDVTVLEVGDVVARRFGEIRAAQLDAGHPTPDLDLVNAATALVHGLTMVTHNTQDYAGIPGLNLMGWLLP